MYPVALEGALKLKEISYIHAEGYAGGEMKHGPIALIDEKMPVVVLAPREPHVPYEKMIGNVEEVRARGGKVIAVVDEDDTAVASLADDVIRDPGALGAARAHRRHGAAAAARVPRGRSARDRRGPAAESRQERHGGVMGPRTESATYGGLVQAGSPAPGSPRTTPRGPIAPDPRTQLHWCHEGRRPWASKTSRD